MQTEVMVEWATGARRGFGVLWPESESARGTIENAGPLVSGTAGAESHALIVLDHPVVPRVELPKPDTVTVVYIQRQTVGRSTLPLHQPLSARFRSTDKESQAKSRDCGYLYCGGGSWSK